MGTTPAGEIAAAKKREMTSSLKSFLIELVVYSLMVFGYFFLVLRYLAGWLYHLFKDERKEYAWVALCLIVLQGVLLEVLTRALLRLIKPHTEVE